MNLIDKSFKSKEATNCHLSVQVDKKGLIYCIFSQDRNRHVVLKKIQFKNVQLQEDLLNNVAHVFLNDDLMDLAFRSTNFMYYSQQSTLIPDTYFEKRYLHDYYSFNHSCEPSDELFCNLIKPLKAWNVFAIPSGLVALVNNQFAQPVFAHQATTFLWPFNGEGIHADGHLVKLGINYDFFDIAVYHKSKLLLYNTFQYVNDTDLLYFVLYIYKQLAIDLQKAQLLVSGEMSNRLLYFETLKKYIPNLVHAGTPEKISLAPGLFSASVHQYLNLLSIHHCVSSEVNTKAGE